jgi:acyl carrier protein
VATALASAAPVLTFAAADWQRLRASEPSLAASGRLDALAVGEGKSPDTRDLMQLEAADRKPAALSIVRTQAAAVLRIDAAKIEANARLGDLGLDSLSSFELWNRIEAASAMAIPLARFVEAATVDSLAELLCALAVENLRLKSTPSSSAPMDAPVEEPVAQTAVLLPRERWVTAMRGARMTSEHGRRALETSLAVTIKPSIAHGPLGAAWAVVAERHTLTAVFDDVAAAEFATTAARSLDGETSARLTCAQADRATQVALRGSRAALDRWSVSLLMQELLELLAGAPAKRKADDACANMRRQELAELTGQQYLRHKIFWAEMLSEAPPPVYFARRNRALAPAGLGLNRGQTVRLHSAFTRDATTTEAELLTDFVEALARATGTGALIVACAHNLRAPGDDARKLVGPLATALPLVCRLQGERNLAAERIALDLRHAKAHAAFDLAACEEAFGAGWRANNIAPLQFGFSYRGDPIALPALLAGSTCRFGSLTAHIGKDSDIIANDIRLSISVAGDTIYAELAYDSDAVEGGFAAALFDVFLKGRLRLHKQQPLQPARG